jgi:hypothetical protein
MMIINKIKMHEPVTIKNDPDSPLLAWVWTMGVGRLGDGTDTGGRAGTLGAETGGIGGGPGKSTPFGTGTSIKFPHWGHLALFPAVAGEALKAVWQFGHAK